MAEIQDRTTRPASLCVLFLILVTVLVYIQSIKFPFLGFDDKQFIVQNPHVQRWASVPSYFTGAEDTSADKNAPKIPNFYRPLVGLWLLLNFKLLGLHPALWHISIIATYALGVWLFWRVAWKLTHNDFVALAAALLFALHPTHVEGIAWISGASVEMLLCVFFLGGFLAYLRWRESQRAVWLVLCGLLTLCALFSKETAAALPVLMVCHALIFHWSPSGAVQRVRPMMRLVLAMAVTTAVYAWLRISAIHLVSISHPRHSWGEVLRTGPLLFVTYLKMAFWPAPLGTWYETQIVTVANGTNFYLPVMICVAYGVLMVWALVRKPLIGFSLLWWLVSLGPPILAVRFFPDFELVHDRFESIPLAGLCLIAASALRLLPGKERFLFGFKAAGVVALAMIVVVLGVLTARQVSAWESDFAMYKHAVETSPRSVRARILYGNELIQQNNIRGALILYRDTLNIDPDRWETLFAYGVTLAHAGDRPDAIRLLKHGIEVAPKKSPLYFALADIEASDGNYDEAFKVIEEGMRVSDQPEILQREMGLIRSRQAHGAGKP